MNFRSSNKTVCLPKYHLIWSPKSRNAVPVGEVETRRVEIIHEVCDEKRAAVLGLEVMADHLHRLAEIPPQVPRSRFSRLLNDEDVRRSVENHKQVENKPQAA